MTDKKEMAKPTKVIKEESSVQSQIVSNDELGLAARSMKGHPFAMWIHVLLQNWRQGTVACKGRSDVARSNKKPFKQKGTGRARAGSARSPLWRGGGVTFGPQARVKTLKVPQQLKSRVLGDLFWQLAEEKRIRLIDFISDKPSTKKACQVLKDAALTNNVVLLLDPKDRVNQLSFVNIPNVHIVLFDQLNAFNLASGKHVVILKKDFEKVKDMVAQWK